MYSEVLVSSGTQVYPQNKLDLDHLADYLPVSYDYADINELFELFLTIISDCILFACNFVVFSQL